MLTKLRTNKVVTGSGRIGSDSDFHRIGATKIKGGNHCPVYAGRAKFIDTVFDRFHFTEFYVDQLLSRKFHFTELFQQFEWFHFTQLQPSEP